MDTNYTLPGVPRLRRSLRIRTYLLLLMLVSAVPFIAFSAFLVTRTVAQQTRGFGRDVTAVARAMSLALDSRINAERTALEALGRSPALAAGDLSAFYKELLAASALLNGTVSLSRPDGEQVLNTQLPMGTPLPRRAKAAHVAQVSATGRPAVSGFTRSALNGRPVATLDVPVAGPGGAGAPWVLAVTVRLDDITQLLKSQRLPADWVAAVADRDGVLLGRTLDHDARVGTLASPHWTVPAQTEPEGWVPSTTLEGVLTDTGYARSDVTGWVVGIGVPHALVRAPLMQALLPLLAFGAALILAGLGAALAVARRIAGPIVALARQGAAPADLDLVEAQQVAAALRSADAERRAAEDALRASEAELRIARELSPQSPWTAGPDGRLLTVSRRVSANTGTPEEARLGLGWLDVVHPDDRSATAAAWSQSVWTALPYDHTFRMKSRQAPSGTSDGWRWMRARAAPLLGADGRPARWYGTTEDVDDHVRAEQALQVSEARLRHLTEDLENRVAAEVAAREAAQAALHQSQRLEALGKLASGVAHDFNNVLQALGGSLTLIQRAPANAARVQRMAEMAQDAVARGTAITGRMLSLARRADLRMEAVDAAALLGDLQIVLQHTLGSGIRVETAAQPGTPALLADRGQLETVLINLAVNARDAMPRGGTLRLFARPAGGEVVIEAEDTGSGMAPDVLARAREPFFTTKPPGVGTGLGLSLAHSFAEQSGGRLDIASTPGKGTVVTLALPQAGAE